MKSMRVYNAGYAAAYSYGAANNAEVRVPLERGIGFDQEEEDEGGGGYERLVEAAVAAAEAEEDEDDGGEAGSGGGGEGGDQRNGVATQVNARGIGVAARDEWSDGATRALLSAWGERHLRLARGGLKLGDWAEVAKIVSSCSASPKTGVQCKNRVDTLKKKFKSEKQKQASSPGRSKWPFFAALERLLNMAKEQQQGGLPGAIDAGEMVRPRGSGGDAAAAAVGAVFDEDGEFHIAATTAAAAAASSSTEEDISSSGEEQEGKGKTKLKKRSRKRKLESSGEGDEEDAAAEPIRELSNAIARFGEIYERIERAKQQQMADLERARMEFARDLELHRMQLLMQAQIEVAKANHQRDEEEEENEDDGRVSVLHGVNLERTTTSF